MNQRKRTRKVTKGHKITMAAASVMGLIAGWNLIGHRELKAVTDELVATTKPATAVPSPVQPSAAVATPWPTIAPLSVAPRLAERPLPTLVAMPPEMFQSDATQSGGPAFDIAGAPQLIPLPTLAPLPVMPEYVAPPPPPPQVAAAPQAAPPPAAPQPPPPGGNNNSGGS